MINPTSGTIKCNFKVKFGLQRVWHDSWGSLKFLWWICMRVACGDRDQEDEGQFWIFQTRKRKLLAYCMNYCHKDGQKDELWLLWSSSWTGPSSCPYGECIGATFSMIIDLNHTKGSLLLLTLSNGVWSFLCGAVVFHSYVLPHDEPSTPNQASFELQVRLGDETFWISWTAKNITLVFQDVLTLKRRPMDLQSV